MADHQPRGGGGSAAELRHRLRHCSVQRRCIGVDVGPSVSIEQIVDQPVEDVFSDISSEFDASQGTRRRSTYTYTVNGVSRQVDGRQTLLDALVTGNIPFSGQDSEERQIFLEASTRAHGGACSAA